MVDLVNMELNKENIKELGCLYKNNQLGNQIEYLWNHSDEENPQSWNVRKNRNVVNINPSATETSSAISADITANNGIAPNIKVNDDTLKQNFQTYILDSAPDVNRLFENYILTYGVNTPSIVDFFKNNRGYATILYNYIEEWNKSMDSQRSSLLAKIQTAKGAIDGIINGLRTQYQTEVDPKKKEIFKRDIMLHELYQAVLVELLKNETAKNSAAYSGGRRRTRRNKKRRKGGGFKRSQTSKKR
jgi:hypothetical protein